MCLTLVSTRPNFNCIWSVIIFHFKIFSGHCCHMPIILSLLFFITLDAVSMHLYVNTLLLQSYIVFSLVELLISIICHKWISSKTVFNEF